ncbi:MAG TPA: competence protein CoiA family protein [Neobacillus sp.]
MLTARTKSGKKICLGNENTKDTLLYLRSKEEFVCPVCGEDVSLKLGDQRIYHFAHRSGGTCRDFYENESNYHMEGKRQLFQWLKRQKIPSELEYYDKEIKQRPDIMFIYNRKKYALEFQCSSIPEQVYLKRTNTYLHNGYHPLWILGGHHFQKKKGDKISLSAFHYLFLRSSSEGDFYIPTYCPENRNFQLIGSIVSYSVKNAFAQNFLFPLNKLDVDGIINPKLLNQIHLGMWNHELEKFILHYTLHQGPQQNSFLRELYNQNLNPFLLPPEIGLPLKHSLFIQTSAIIWQTYLYLDVLSKRQPNETFSIQEIDRSFKKRIARKEIIIRKLPQLEQFNPVIAGVEYLRLLEKLGFLIRRGDTLFQLQKNLLLPRTNREREEGIKSFYQKNQHFLSII